jgi:hypothetical protein
LTDAFNITLLDEAFGNSSATTHEVCSIERIQVRVQGAPYAAITNSRDTWYAKTRTHNL